MCYCGIMNLVVFNNKCCIEVIVVGIGFVGVVVVVILGELGYKVKVFMFYDSFCWVYSIVVQGGINVVKNY